MTKLTTPMDMAISAANAAKDNVEAAIGKLRGVPTFQEQAEAARLQIELAHAVALIEVARQLQALSAMATPGQSIRYGMAEVAEALRNSGGPVQ